MLGLEDLEIGLVFAAGADARATLEHVKSFGLRAGQLVFRAVIHCGVRAKFGTKRCGPHASRR